MSIKLKQPTMRLATLFFFVNLVMRWNGHVFYLNSLNRMTNAAYENAMRRCHIETNDKFFLALLFLSKKVMNMPTPQTVTDALNGPYIILILRIMLYNKK